MLFTDAQSIAGRVCKQGEYGMDSKERSEKNRGFMAFHYGSDWLELVIRHWRLLARKAPLGVRLTSPQKG